MDILEFLFNNFFFVLLLIGILSGLFGGKKKSQQQRTPSRPGAGPVQTQRIPERVDRPEDVQPQTVGVERPWETLEPKRPSLFDLELDEDVEPPVTERPRPEPIQAEAIKRHERVRDRRANIPNVSVEDEISDMIHATRQQPSQVQYSSEAKELLDFKQIDQKSVIQGMVWSQVFGKPRVMDPHRTNVRARLGRRSMS